MTPPGIHNTKETEGPSQGRGRTRKGCINDGFSSCDSKHPGENSHIYKLVQFLRMSLRTARTHLLATLSVASETVVESKPGGIRISETEVLTKIYSYLDGKQSCCCVEAQQRQHMKN